MNEYTQKLSKISGLIGNTPLVEINFKYKGQPRTVYAKAEYYNLTGSIKDRVAYYVIEKAYETGSIKPTDVICEATSGNTGISFCAVGTYMGHKVRIYMPDWMSSERINLMKAYGAEVILVSKEQGGFLGSISMTQEFAKNGGVFLPKQFSNEDNTLAHYHTTAKEISQTLKKNGLCADIVVAGVGTGGTVMGIGTRLKEDNSNLKICPLEPQSSPTLSTGYKVGKHRIQGISDEFIPDLLKLDKTDKIINVDDADSIIMARMLSEKLGLGVGISSGANFLGCIDAQNIYGSDKVAVTVFADDNKKYLSTDYCVPQKMQDDFISKDVELQSVRCL